MNLNEFANLANDKLDKCILNDATRLEELQYEIRNDFNNCLCANIGEKLTKYDDLYCHKLKPQCILVYRSKEIRTYISIGGAVTYYRRQYIDTRTGEKFYFIDEAIGLQKAHRITKLFKARVLSLRQELSCRGVANALFGLVSRQSVCRILYDSVPDDISFDFCSPSSQNITDVFVEADEAHTVLSNGKRCCVNLAYVHEGYVSSSSTKNTLCNPFFVPQPIDKNIWHSVYEYIQRRYPKNVQIHVRGDGANWIKAALFHLPNSDFKLDKFHTQKAIRLISQRNHHIEQKLYSALMNHNHIELTECYDLAIKKDTEKFRIQAFEYLDNNFKYIDLSEENHCSAEGHISHIYASKMSSRPCCWSKKGLLKFAMLRALFYSKIDIKSLFEKQLRFKSS